MGKAINLRLGRIEVTPDWTRRGWVHEHRCDVTGCTQLVHCTAAPDVDIDEDGIRAHYTCEGMTHTCHVHEGWAACHYCGELLAPDASCDECAAEAAWAATCLTAVDEGSEVNA